MRILHLIGSVDRANGGPIEGLLQQDAACRDAGLAVVREIASLDPPDSPHAATFPIRVHALGRPRALSPTPWRRLLDRWRYSPDYLVWLRANVARYDAVIVDGLWNYTAFAGARALVQGPTPYFVFPHGMMSAWFSRHQPIKHVAKQALWLVSEGRLLGGAAGVLFTCEGERLQAEGQFFGHDYKSRVVDFGTTAPPVRTAAQDTAFRAAVPDLGERPYLLFLARLHPIKGCDLLIEAFARVMARRPGIDLVIAGPDAEGLRARLEALADRLGASDRIHWPGPLYGDAKWGAFHGAEAFVMPSHLESFGLAAAEALGCGLPVLVSNKVNIWREIDAAGAGLVETDDVDGVEALLTRWFALPEEKRNEMGTAAQRLFNAHFDVARSAATLIETISGMIPSDRRSTVRRGS